MVGGIGKELEGRDNILVLFLEELIKTKTNFSE
jgi:hypothetical protein